MDTLSLTGKTWELPPANQAATSGLIQQLIERRNISTELTLTPPSIFPDMARAVERITQAIDNNEKIGIFGDYDCDGISGTALLLRFFRRRGVEPWVRLPHRVRDGYGLKQPIVDEVVEAGINLLITTDTGITAINEIATLNSHGIDTIVTDHHEPREELPLAYALIHPVLSKHSAPHPAGSGVAYKLVHALEGKPWEDMNTDISIAMFGTVADLVELRGENRALTILGLQALANIPSGPVAELRERCKSTDAPLTATDVAFRIAPRLNAAGRMGEPDLALRALTEGGDALATLDFLNEQRQSLTKELCDRAVAEFDTDNLPPLLVSISGDYPHGIVGLIAGRLTETFGRPSLVAHTDGVSCTASLRSPKAYHIALGLNNCDKLLTNFGGHAQAAGCTFPLKNKEAITDALNQDILSHIDSELLVPHLLIDACITLQDITLDTCTQLQSLEPFGQGNPEPKFLLRDIDLSATRSCGKHDAHLTGRIGNKKCVGFTLGNFAAYAEPVDLVVRLEVSEWNGRTEPQLVIEDIALATKKVQTAAPL